LLTSVEGKVVLGELVEGSNWAKLLPQLELSGVALNLASNCHYDKLQGNQCILTLSDQHASLWSENYTERIARALSSYFGKSLTVDIQVGSLAAETPAQLRERQRKEQLEDALVAIKEDENIKTLLNDFDGVLITESVRPV
jgi:DNA polymerase-3 subunit gamma/tau